jgi:hypothetical protein
LSAVRGVCALTLAAALACAPPAAAEVTPETAAARIVGTYDNAAQVAAADPALLRPPAPGHPYDWIDLQHAHFHRVDAPAIGAAVLYLEWRAGGADGPISRQRIWSFRIAENGATVMDFFTFRAPEPFAGRGAVAGAFRALKPDDLIGYGPVCALAVTDNAAGGFVAETTIDRCKIVARSGRAMGIAARVVVRDAALDYAEAGVLDGGAYAFKVPGAGAYAFQRNAR